ncbi:MAG: MBL fold metallo-hydrolase, partial [Clostridia bacterium]|nr:MBL fold metallo-hydrolase [Clostridia bacterium]
MKKAISLILIVVLSFGLFPAVNGQGVADMAVYFIDCGQGDAVFITSEGKTMLVDAGKAKNVQSVLNFLDAQGIEELDYVFSSHPDEDHIGGMPAIYENYQVNSSVYSSYTAQTSIYQKYMSAIAKEPDSEASVADEKDHWTLGDAQIDVLSDGKDYSNANDASVVLKVSCGETSLLLTGDISQSVEADLVASEKDLDVDILKVGHHGSATSSSAAFLDATSPKVAVISVGAGNSYGHPTQAALNRLSAVCANIYRTDRAGTVLLEVADDQ